MAGEIGNHQARWREITKNKRILETVEDGLKLRWRGTKPAQFNMDREKIQYADKMDGLVQEYLKRGVIKRSEDPTQYTSPFFLIKQKEKLRPILDLRFLNNFIEKEHFKMEGLPVAKQMLRKGDWMTKVDLKDAYQAVPLAEESKKYLGFKWKGGTYNFQALPFGLSSAPRDFTKLMRTALTPLREQGMRLVFYLDDILIMARSRAEALEDTKKLIKHLGSLGLATNEKKCKLDPAHEMEFLGMTLNSARMSISIPKEKIRKVISEIRKVGKLKRIQMRKLAALSGTLTSLAFGFSPSQIHQRLLQRNLILFMNRKIPWDNQIPVFKTTKRELKWWERHLGRLNGIPLLEREGEEVHIYTDASKTGWGGVFSETPREEKHHHLTSIGQWSQEEKEFSSNFRELKAILMTLKDHAKELSEKRVVVHSDNTTAISQINRQSNPKHLHLIKLTKEIWNLCLRNRIKLRTEYIPGEENRTADAMSRLNWQYEWELTDRVFQRIERKWGPISVDLFASTRNKKLARFYSLFPSREALGRDAFKAERWPDNAYANPPPILINRILQRITGERIGSLILVTPFWPSQTWWAECMQLAQKAARRKKRTRITSPLRIPVRKGTATLNGKRHELPYKELAVWKLSGKP